MGRLNGKTAFISGAARGLGAEMARLMHSEGANVMVSDILVEEGEVLVDGYDNMSFVAHDVLDEDQWVSAYAATQDTFGGLDILVNNAGIAHDATPLESTSLEQWRRVVGIDLDAVFLGCKHAIPMMKQRGGSIVNISSIYGIVGSAGQAPYHAAKGGVRLLSKALAVELAQLEYKIRVNSVHPGFVVTDLVREGLKRAVDNGLMPGENEAVDQLTLQTPMGRLGAPRDIAHAVLFLASDESAWVTGTELVVDGGYTAQ